MTAPRVPEPFDAAGNASRPGPVTHVWYAAYGSNTHPERLDCYLAGGRPPGGRRDVPGCRDPRRPRRSAPVLLRGRLYFATESAVWTGGRAFYDPEADGELPAHAYLLTVSQFSDIAAQEMYREPDRDLDLTRVLARGRDRLGPGRYETLVCAGLLDGHPVLTFTAPWRSTEVPPNPPAAAYLRHIAAGIGAAHGWPPRRTAAYLATCPGVHPRWSAPKIAALLTADPAGSAPAAPPARSRLAE
ncbi:histone deacetylase [Streptomyces yunnanensis]|uniref:Histone deacetylase n=1 Tax=Streptomyces yunnanensis TaxID=156453 RepID=A0ABY8AHZ6_9ACTN|nr:histone deacetylase [Streptomyces yunnanensis]WEB43814.1 histone deacetylase [Streptomyces yunnanensis]